MNYLPDPGVLVGAIAKAKKLNSWKSAAAITLRAPIERKQQPNMLYTELADFLQYDVFEVEVIFTKMLRIPDETLRSQLETILLVGRMLAGEEIAALHESHQRLKQDYADGLIKYQQDLAMQEEARKEYEAQLGEADSIREIWHTFIRELQQSCDAANNQIAALSDQDRRIVRVLNKQSRHIRLPPADDEGVFDIDWLMLHDCHSVHISVMLEKVSKMNEA